MDSRSRITAEPNPIPYAAGPGSTVISWDTRTGSPAEVWVAVAGKETLFARGSSGTQEVSWILPEAAYEFRLRRKGKSRKLLAAVTVAMTPATRISKVRQFLASSQLASGRGQPIERTSLKREAFIRADPNPIPVGPGLGSTTISWSTGNGKVGVIYLVVAGEEEIPFQQGAAGSHHVGWIKRDVVYHFRLYELGEGRVRLAATTVTMGNEPLEIALDVAFLAGLVAIPVALLVAIVGAGRRLARWAARISSPPGRCAAQAPPPDGGR
jgi:hypothetical protein